MKQKNTATRPNVRRGNLEGRLAFHKKLGIATKGGTFFELRRADPEKRNLLAELHRIIKEIPIERETSSRQLSSIFLEDRE